MLDHVRELLYAAEQRPQFPHSARSILAGRFADATIQLLALRAMELQCVEASALKIRGTAILNSMCEPALDLEATMGAAHDPAGSHRSPHEPLSPVQQASLVAYKYLYGRCWSIFGGINEIQRNIIPKQILAWCPGP